MAWCKLCCKDGGRPSRPTCKHTTKATPKKSRQTCFCSGSHFPHRYGSSLGRFGCCEHHPLASEKIYAIMDAPVRIAGRSR